MAPEELTWTESPQFPTVPRYVVTFPTAPASDSDDDARQVDQAAFDASVARGETFVVTNSARVVSAVACAAAVVGQ